ncbi:MAG TPA: hypothetical protein VG013_24700 [Gemmataceae bacterium]|nr:hypothetical protein [Gemmataceae bacterium]
MAPRLTEEQRQALDAHRGAPIRVFDVERNQTYVLMPADTYERVKALFEEDHGDLRDTYHAQLESAMRAGWDDPAMDEYNNYDAHRS